jgi:prefoldin alpha subunit
VSNKQQVVDPNELMAQYEAVKSQISQLRTLISQLLLQKDGVEKAKSSIDSISNGDDMDTIFPLDPGYTAMIFAKPSDRNHYIIYLGADIFAKLETPEAMKVLTERESELDRAINDLNQRLNQLEKLQEQYEAVLQQIAVALQQQK